MSDIVRRTLRLRKDLDRRLSEKADKMGVSINAFISMVLSKELLNEEPKQDQK